MVHDGFAGHGQIIHSSDELVFYIFGKLKKKKNKELIFRLKTLMHTPRIVRVYI